MEALAEAATVITEQPEAPVDTYIRVTNAKVDRNLILSIVKNPEVQFKTTPQNTLQLGDFLHRLRAIKNTPASVKDYFLMMPP